MSREFIELLRRRQVVRERVLRSLHLYLCHIWRLVKEVDPAAEILLFGSYVRGTARPDSDVDVLVVSDVIGGDPSAAAAVIDKVYTELGICGIFEIHVATREAFIDWYKKFIDVALPVQCQETQRRQSSTGPS